MTLHCRLDEGKIDLADVLIRRDVLEIRRTASGRVFFQCACCRHRPSGERASLSTLTPQRVESLHRAFARFAMHHVPACEYVSQEIKELSLRNTAAKTVGNRDAKKYWVASALRKGLRNSDDGESIVFG